MTEGVRIRSVILLACCGLIVVGASIAVATRRTDADSGRLFGYPSADSAVEVNWETKFRALPQPADIRATMQELSAYPHNAGSERQRENAQWILNRFKSFGLDAHIEQYQSLYATPKERVLELVSPTKFTATLKEPPIPVDPTSGQAGQLPTFNVYSADGDVTAPLVYVNYGVPADYDQLAQMHVDVRGKIVIARYGNSWRGIKPKVAYEHGAVGCIIYSDPRDDGYYQGEAFPVGPMRPEQGVQRGSVLEMEVEPGDPETPGWGATPGSRRLSFNQVTTLQKIPVLPISWGDALPLLRALGGPVAPDPWRGALPITYHVGGGPATVHLVAKFNWSVIPLYDVIAVIPGSTYPDQWVMRGNHYDAWVNGAGDPISGQSALLAEARAYGDLLKQGWRPKRTIVYAAWDGEEPGLLGSTEFAEAHAAELQQKALVYYNSDSNYKGWLELGGSHSLEHFLNGVAQSIPDPENQQDEASRLAAHRGEAAQTPAQKAAIRDGADLRIGALGSGSDYTPFLQHLGIATASIQYGGAIPSAGVYHSIYDDFYWYTHFGDDNFAYGRALAETVGTAVMRMADADVIPLQFTDSALNIGNYLDGIEATYKSSGAVPAFDFRPTEDAVARLMAAAADYDRALSAAADSGALFRASAQKRDALNELLLQSERKLLDPAGLPRRPWYQNQIYAPGYYTGYAVKTLPGLREAIEQKNFAEAAREQSILVRTLDRYTAQIKAARADLP